MIKVYTTSWCPDCHAAKRLMKEKNVDFEEINIDDDPGSAILVEKANDGKRKVPTFEVDGEYFNASPFNKNKLLKQLKLL